jgi:hypothetical protein
MSSQTIVAFSTGGTASQALQGLGHCQTRSMSKKWLLKINPYPKLGASSDLVGFVRRAGALVLFISD